ncbi:MAG: aminotransferase class I/II-fold pyridoxal phosphate-dependent enzyme [Flavobacteriales bacterium]|nr:aminotransferase class I/II-fold pyridoxal phosphate-dependent enzyme [Flavobacteriales bacterium]
MNYPVSDMAENLIGSEIIKLGGEINRMIAEGAKVHNMTIGDFDPEIFPIPQELTNEIVSAYRSHKTNYPPADGIRELRQAVSDFLWKRGNLAYPADNILIAGGARPIIYSIYQTLVDPGEKVIFPVPSWNNNHYCHLTRAQQILIEAKPENNFMPIREDIEPYIGEAVMVAVCSPLNPTGTVFSRKQLEDICDLILEENARRGPDKKPVYLMYDQIYWMLTFGNVEHFDPVSLRPAMKDYTVYVDGISKSLAATGVRVGWAFGPTKIMAKMRAILGHIGAWAPKAEQVATAHYLNNENAVDGFIEDIKQKVSGRLFALHQGISQMNRDGLPVMSIQPEGAIYLSVKFNLLGKKTPDGETIQTTTDIFSYLLENAGFAAVPFTAFGNSPGTEWFRVSVGTCRQEDIPGLLENMRAALSRIY